MKWILVLFCYWHWNSAFADSNSSVLVSPYQNLAESKKEYRIWSGEKPGRILLTDQDQTPEIAAVDVVQFLKSSKKKQALVCFGRAAADCLEALLIYPELQKKVTKLTALQGKVLGLEKAEGLLSPFQEHQQARRLPILQQALFYYNQALAWLFPHKPGLYSMNPLLRSRHLTHWKPRIREMSQRLKIQSIDTSNAKYGVIPYSHQIQLSQSEKKLEL